MWVLLGKRPDGDNVFRINEDEWIIRSCVVEPYQYHLVLPRLAIPPRTRKVAVACRASRGAGRYLKVLPIQLWS